MPSLKASTTKSKKLKKPFDPTTTPDSLIKNVLHRGFLWSRERSTAIKRDLNTCHDCGAKGSLAKGREVRTEVHHQLGEDHHDINWERIFTVLREELYCHPDFLVTLCHVCHLKRHGKEPRKKKEK